MGSTITVLIENQKFWVRGFRNDDGTVFEFSDGQIGHKIKDFIFLGHGSNYNSLLGGSEKLEDFDVGYPILVKMVKGLAHFALGDDATPLRLLAALLVHSAESIKNTYVSGLVCLSYKFLANGGEYKVYALGAQGQYYINKWAKISGYILLTLDQSLLIWDADIDSYIPLKHDYFVPVNRDLVSSDFLFLKTDEYNEGAFANVNSNTDGCELDLVKQICSDIGVIAIDGVNYVMIERGSRIPYSAKITLGVTKETQSTVTVVVLEGNRPILTQLHFELFNRVMRLTKVCKIPKTVLVELKVNSTMQITMSHMQLGLGEDMSWQTVQMEIKGREEDDDVMRLYSPLLWKMEARLARAAKAFPAIKDITRIFSETKKPPMLSVHYLEELYRAHVASQSSTSEEANSAILVPKFQQSSD